ncbi:SNF7 family protein [Myxacorys almedinensis]|uniref:Heterocyst differentiation related protein n=1 Tax=Myxacorys almedinensis A TaxID=2690445 RepID=A0A8J7Z6H4_9CYAN|nr:SNF7 family protein [Myxacorys almedinensis]NDJ17323.1 hypothetical protein [Myxacorys almedinensis A]
MSDTTSFLGGAAIAGLAAIVLLRGGVSANSPSLPSSQPLAPVQPYSTIPPYPVSPGMYPPGAMGSPVPDYEKQRLETDQLRSQVEQQRTQIDQLKAQAQSQQAFIDTLTAQNKTNGGSALPARATPTPTLNPEPSNPVINGLMWALGGMILTFGGGIALVSIFVLFARQQRPSRTIEVFHEDYPTYLTARRRSQALPTRRTIRRVEAEDLD